MVASATPASPSGGTQRSSGSGPFVLTGNEWNAAREHAEYVLYHVVDLTTPARTRMRVFRNLKDRLKEEHVSAAGWAVTGWRNLEPEEIPVQPITAAPSPRADRSEAPRLLPDE